MSDSVDGSEAITPRVLQTPRAAGVAGVLFAVLFALIVVLVRRSVPADPTDAGDWLADDGRRRQIRFALGLLPFCGIFFLWFMGVIRARIGDAEDKFLATVLLGSGLLFVAMLFTFGALFGALVALADHHDGHPPIDVWRLGRTTTFNIASVYAVRMGAVFMIASTTIAVRLGIHRRGGAAIGYGAAILLLVAATWHPWLLLVFPLWVLFESVHTLVRSYRVAT